MAEAETGRDVVLTLSCPDRRGVVHAVSGAMLEHELTLERRFPADAKPYRPRGDSERSFGRDMQAVRRKVVELPLQPGAGKQRESDLPIGWQWDGPSAFRGHHEHFVSHGDQFVFGPRQCLHDAVDLGTPGVGNNRYSHAAHGWRHR